MTWVARLLPGVTHAVHALEVTRRDETIAALTTERDYWRARAEKLIDAALARANAIHEPTMRDVPPPVQPVSAMLASALSVTEIDSTKGRH